MSELLPTDLRAAQEAYLVGPNWTISGDLDSDICYVFFSGHGIYFPNTEECFKQRIVVEDRFEWQALSRSLPGRHIFVRDVYKQWYIKGVSSEISDDHKLEEFLRESVRAHREIIFVGSSAGGYSALRFGLKLGVSRVFTFSGQFDLSLICEDVCSRARNPLLFEAIERNPGWDGRSLVPGIASSNLPIYYFYPAFSEGDIAQSEAIDGVGCIWRYSIRSSNHGRPFAPSCFLRLLQMSVKELEVIHSSMFGGRPVSPTRFAVRVLGFRKGLIEGLKHKLRTSSRLRRISLFRKRKDS